MQKHHSAIGMVFRWKLQWANFTGKPQTTSQEGGNAPKCWLVPGREGVNAQEFLLGEQQRTNRRQDKNNPKRNTNRNTTRTRTRRHLRQQKTHEPTRNVRRPTNRDLWEKNKHDNEKPNTNKWEARKKRNRCLPSVVLLRLMYFLH